MFCFGMNEINVKSRFRTRCLVFVGKHVCNICMFRIALSDSFVRSPLIDISVEHKDQLLMPCYVNRSTNHTSPVQSRPYQAKDIATYLSKEANKVTSCRSLPLGKCQNKVRKKYSEEEKKQPLHKASPSQLQINA